MQIIIAFYLCFLLFKTTMWTTFHSIYYSLFAFKVFTFKIYILKVQITITSKLYEPITVVIARTFLVMQ